MPRTYATGLIRTADLIEWTSMRRGRDGGVVVSTGRAPVPSAGPNDAAAEEAAWRSAFQQARARGARLAQEVSVGLPTERVLLRVLRLPPAEPDELRGMVELQFDKIAPFPPETMVLSYEVLERWPDTWLVLMAAAQQETVEEYRRWLAAGGIRPRRLDVELAARLRLLRDAGALQKKGRRILVILDQSAPHIVITEDGAPLILRALPGYEGLSEEELAGELSREVALSVLSLEMEFGAGPPTEGVVWHRGPAPLRVMERLGQDGACPVQSHAIETLPPVSEGLARRMLDGGTSTLDLTPPAWRDAERQERFRRRLWNGLGATLLAWATTAGGFVGWRLFEQARLARLNAERSRWSGPATEVRDLRRRVALIRRYRDKTHSALECWRVITENQTPGVDLASLTYRKGESVKLSGEAQTVQQVYDFKAKLDATGLFVSCTLQGPRLDPSRGKQLFDIDIALPGGRP